MSPAAEGGELAELADAWQHAWPEALAAWSRFTRLRPPRLCLSAGEARAEGLTGSFAMIRLSDQAIVVSLPEVAAAQLHDYAREILAHEVGHHVYAPATLLDHGRTIARVRAALPSVERHAPMIANLYTDLLINDRLQRSAGLRMADVFRALSRGDENTLVWQLYVRVYEVLWSLPRGTLGSGTLEDHVEGDAWLCSRLIRSYSRDWLGGCGRFASLFLPYVLDDKQSLARIERLLDTRAAGQHGEPAGLIDEEVDERSGAIHPAADPELSDVEEDAPAEGPTPMETSAPQRSLGQARQPFEYGELLRAIGLSLTDHEVAVRYYREKALPYVVPFPSRRLPESVEPLMEGLEPWDIGSALDELDLFQSVLASPRMIPGVTTLQRTWGASEGGLPEREPFDLDLYVDSSGSMPNPQVQLSFPTLAGAIIALSALRAGARVQATLWSGKHQFTGTDGFVRDEQAILRTLTGFFGGGTAFPIHRLRDSFDARLGTATPAHILVISDDGVSTMFDDDERGESGWAVAARALAKARGGGTFVLQLPENWDVQAQGTGRGYYYDVLRTIARARAEQAWHVHRVATWEELIEFARSFSRQRYA